MRALAGQFYAGQQVRAGDSFVVANEGDAADLEALRFAKREALAPVSEVPATAAPKKGTYARRDMRARDNGSA